MGRLRGIPVRLHWTLPVGALIFGGLSPLFWVAFFGLVLLHEMGHAAVVRHFRHRVEGIDITGFGGMCRWSGYASERERSVIAWGGVAAQAILLAVAFALVLLLGSPTSYWGRELAHAAIRTNAILIVINLLPFPPLDGAQAWKLFRSGSDRRGPPPPMPPGRRRGRRPAESWRYSSR